MYPYSEQDYKLSIKCKTFIGFCPDLFVFVSCTWHDLIVVVVFHLPPVMQFIQIEHIIFVYTLGEAHLK